MCTYTVTEDDLRQRLTAEVNKVIASGHLRPGYRGVGVLDGKTAGQLGDHLIDYRDDPSDTLYTLILALPHLQPDLQLIVKAYLRAEYAAALSSLSVHTRWME